MEQENINIRDNISLLMQIRGINNPNQLAEKLKGQVTQPALYTLIRHPEENNPTTKTLRAIAKVLVVEAWMLLIKDFPMHLIKKKPLKKISPEGYALLQGFEASSDETKQAILRQASLLMNEIDNNSAERTTIKEVTDNYTTTHRTI